MHATQHHKLHKNCKFYSVYTSFRVIRFFIVTTPIFHYTAIKVLDQLELRNPAGIHWSNAKSVIQLLSSKEQ